MECSAQKPYLLIEYFITYCPLLIFIYQFCAVQKKKKDSCKHDTLQQDRSIKEKCSAKDLMLLKVYFSRYCHLLFFILKFCLEHILKRLRGINMKL